MNVFIFIVLIFTGYRIHADVFQTSRSDSTVKLTEVDGELLSDSGSLLFDVKSCSKVQIRINLYDSLVVIDIYPNNTSQMMYCGSSGNGCTEEVLAISGEVCDDYIPLWVDVSSGTYINIGKDCEVVESQLWKFCVSTCDHTSSYHHVDNGPCNNACYGTRSDI